MNHLGQKQAAQAAPVRHGTPDADPAAPFPVELSIIVPMYNEEESIGPMYEAVTKVAASLGRSYEVIFVDDGSKDKTFELGRALAAADGRLRMIKFRKNSGQTPAMAAGIDNARGRILITMDGDLQNDPRDIQAFLDKIDQGFDIVCGIRQKRQDTFLTRKVPSKIANWIIGKVTGVPIKDNGCSLKAYRASIIKSIPLYSEMHRFIPAMTSMSGAQVEQIPVRHHARQFGQSKYGLSRTYRVILDLMMIKTIVAYVSRPLRWFFLMAAVAFTAGAGCLAAALANFISHPERSAVVLFGLSQIMFMLGIYLVFSGVLCEMIYKTGNLKIKNLSRLRVERFGFSQDPANAPPKGAR